MTRIKFTRDYRFAHDGIHVVAYEKNQIVDLLNEHEVGVIVGVGAAVQFDEEQAEAAIDNSLISEEISVEDGDEEEVIDETIPEELRTKDSPTVKTRKGGKK